MNDRVGLIGVSVRAAAEALSSDCLYRVLDFYCDWDTELVAPGRCSPLSLDKINDFLPFASVDGELTSRPATRWLTTGGLDLEPAALVALQSPPNQLLGFSLAAIRYCKDPTQWSHQLQQAGLAILPIKFQPNCPPGHWHLKRGWPETAPTWFWQQHVQGTLASAIFLARESGVELVGSSRLYVGSDWRYQGNVADRHWPHDAARKTLEEVARTLADRIELRGLFGVDFILGEHLWPLEINPRPTASVEVLASLYGRNLFREHVEACWPAAGGLATNGGTAGPHLPGTSELSWSAKRIVYNSAQEFLVTDDRFQQFKGLLKFQPIPHPTKTLAHGTFRLADLPHPGTIVPPHEPICSILFHLPKISTEQAATAEAIWTELTALDDRILEDTDC